MNKKYLPSRQFVVRLLILIAGVVIVLGIYETVSYFRNRHSNLLKTPITLSVKDLVQKDSNNNGIPDWEEALWGLDPNTSGPANKEYILAKQKALADENGDTNKVANNASATNNNEELSQEFFAVIMSLQETGNLDDNAMQSVTDAIGQKMVADPIPDVYTNDMLTIKDSSMKSKIAYFKALNDLINKYKSKNIGSELSFVATALKNNDAGALKQVKPIGDAYIAFSKDLISIPVPANVASTDIDLANNYDKVGQTIYSLTDLFTNSIEGMKGIISYKKYSSALTNDIQTLSDNLQ